MRIWRWAWSIGAVIALSTCAFGQSSASGYLSTSTAITPAQLISTIPTKPTYKETFRAEKITPEERQSLDDAETALREAQRSYQAVLDKVKGAHGEQHQSYMEYASGTTVEIRGDWALITTYYDPFVGALEIWNSQTPKVN